MSNLRRVVTKQKPRSIRREEGTRVVCGVSNQSCNSSSVQPSAFPPGWPSASAGKILEHVWRVLTNDGLTHRTLSPPSPVSYSVPQRGCFKLPCCFISFHSHPLPENCLTSHLTRKMGDIRQELHWFSKAALQMYPLEPSLLLLPSHNGKAVSYPKSTVNPFTSNTDPILSPFSGALLSVGALYTLFSISHSLPV